METKPDPRTAEERMADGDLADDRRVVLANACRDAAFAANPDANLGDVTALYRAAMKARR